MRLFTVDRETLGIQGVSGLYKGLSQTLRHSLWQYTYVVTYADDIDCNIGCEIAYDIDCDRACDKIHVCGIDCNIDLDIVCDSEHKVQQPIASKTFQFHKLHFVNNRLRKWIAMTSLEGLWLITISVSLIWWVKSWTSVSKWQEKTNLDKEADYLFGGLELFGQAAGGTAERLGPDCGEASYLTPYQQWYRHKARLIRADVVNHVPEKWRFIQRLLYCQFSVVKIKWNTIWYIIIYYRLYILCIILLLFINQLDQKTNVEAIW